VTRRIIEVLACDICQTELEVEAVQFTWNKKKREICLCPLHGDSLLMQHSYPASTAPKRLVMRKLPSGKQPIARQQPDDKPSTWKEKMAKREADNAIRDWARANGFEVGKTGRIPRDIRELYVSTDGEVPQESVDKMFRQSEMA
jgi:hypothetical protein